MKTIYLDFDEFNFDEGVDAISLVSVPAIEKNFLKFSKDKSNYTFARFDSDKQIVTGAALIPEKEIYRYDQDTGEEYNIKFSKDTVRKAAETYLKRQSHKATVEHEESTDKVYLIESWVKENHLDKSTALGYQVPNGTWMVSMKVDDDELWQKVKSDEIQGFSIEAWMVEASAKLTKQEPDLKEEIWSALKELINKK